MLSTVCSGEVTSQFSAVQRIYVDSMHHRTNSYVYFITITYISHYSVLLIYIIFNHSGNNFNFFLDTL